MGTPGERKALLFLGAVLILGAGVRVARAVTGKSELTPAAKSAIERQINTVDSARKHGKKKGKKKREPKPEVVVPAIIDMDIATAEQIETLRGIGPALAQRIVADRDSLGPFGSMAELQRVKGVGPRLAAKIDSTVTFSLLPRPSTTETARSSGPLPGRRKPRRGRT
ncbi:MAG TPA: helix-hairpin-helix domain-containing protein [Gemmatimonadaceae bacterium]|nr:helix-hairpin-helix domain-containing protein [Gemmatimonadaceae bacterium]